MHVLILGLVLLIIAHDEMALPRPAPLGHDLLITITLMPIMAAALLYWAACRRTLRNLTGSSAGRAMRRMDLASSLYRLSIAVIFTLGLYYGTLDATRGAITSLIHHLTGHAIRSVVLLDELVILTPPMCLLFWAWFCYYPIDYVLRESALISHADQGLPIHPIWTRRQFILAQFRHQVALVLVPLLLLIAWRESVRAFVPSTLFGAGWDARAIVEITGSVAVFILTPPLILALWDTQTLPEGELSVRLKAMCKQHGVGVRRLVLWHTFGGMINAAVMGVVAPMRYVLLTDALLEMVSMREVEAVMAHEIAHIRRHHIPWLLATALAAIALLETFWTAALSVAAAAMHEHHWPEVDASLLEPLAVVISVIMWAMVFGWVSRRYERQADTFAVQHLSRESKTISTDTGELIVTPEAVAVMCSALGHVASLNHISPKRNSWRHGSIAWRQDYLRGLVGQPIDRLSIDRVVPVINYTALALLLVLIVLSV